MQKNLVPKGLYPKGTHFSPNACVEPVETLVQGKTDSRFPVSCLLFTVYS